MDVPQVGSSRAGTNEMYESIPYFRLLVAHRCPEDGGDVVVVGQLTYAFFRLFQTGNFGSATQAYDRGYVNYCSGGRITDSGQLQATLIVYSKSNAHRTHVCTVCLAKLKSCHCPPLVGDIPSSIELIEPTQIAKKWR
jgi:hypothetical protein